MADRKEGHSLQRPVGPWDTGTKTQSVLSIKADLKSLDKKVRSRLHHSRPLLPPKPTKLASYTMNMGPTEVTTSPTTSYGNMFQPST